jgi:eukaryotic-like serine/threonine-protein kinase
VLSVEDPTAVLSSAPTSASALLRRYRPFAKLARGGMADIFLAISENAAGVSRTVVLKRLRPDVLAEAEERFTSMFRDEARLATQLNHPNIVHTYEVEEEGQELLIVMEYAEGHTLGEIQRAIRKGEMDSLSHAQLARLMVEVLAGLQYAHDLKDYKGAPLQIVHRDVSPQNVMVGYDGRVRVLDFGIAKATMQSSQTEVGMLKGKVRYMSPEHVDPNATVDRRADIFSCGVVLWELVTRQRLFPSDMSVTSLVSLVNPAIAAPRASSAAPEIHPMLDSVIAKSLEKVAAHRFQTAAEMKRALEEYLMAAGEMVALEDIGAAVGKGFATVRERLAAQVQSELAEAHSQPDSRVRGRLEGLTDLNRGMSKTQVSAATQTSPGSGSVSGLSEVGALPTAQGTPSAESRPSNNGNKKAAVFFLGGMALVGALGGAFYLGQGRSKPDPIPSASTVSGPLVSAASSESVGVPTIAPRETAASSAGTHASLALPIGSTKTVLGFQAPPVKGGGPPPKVVPNGALPAPQPAPTPKVEAPTVFAPTEKGTLTVDTYPWTRVSVDGRGVGNTPVVGLSLPVGNHTVTMENAEEKISRSVQVTIESGKATTKRFSFEK